MDQFLDQIKFLLKAAWDEAVQEAGRHLGLVVVGVAVVVLLLWLFLLPGVKKKGY